MPSGRLCRMRLKRGLWRLVPGCGRPHFYVGFGVLIWWPAHRWVSVSHIDGTGEIMTSEVRRIGGLRPPAEVTGPLAEHTAAFKQILSRAMLAARSARIWG